MASLAQSLSGAGSGMAAGASFGPIGAGVGAVAGGLLGSMGPDPAEAARKAAEAQQAEAARWRQEVNAEQNRAESLLMTPAQMQAHGIALNSQESNIKRQEQVVQSMNPALISAGKQLNDLIQGKSAPVMNNLNQQRQLQRQQMVDQLNQQMGPGASSSAAGMKALSDFDAQTSNMQTQTQQSYMKQIADLPLEGGQLGDALGMANERLNAVSQASPEAQKADMIAKFTQIKGMAEGAAVNAAGGQYMGDVIAGQQQQSALQNVAGGIGAVGGMMNKKKDATTPEPTPSVGSGGGGSYSFGDMTPNIGGSAGAPGPAAQAANLPGLKAPSMGGTYPQVGAPTQPFNIYGVGSNVAGGGSYAQGGRIPGKAPHPRKNTLANDIITIDSTPGEIVVPLSNAKSRKKSHAYIDKLFDDEAKGKETRVRAEKKNYAEGSNSPAKPGTFEHGYNSLMSSVGAPDLMTSGATSQQKRDSGADYYKNFGANLKKNSSDPSSFSKGASGGTYAHGGRVKKADTGYKGGKLKPDPEDMRHPIDHYYSNRKHYA